MKFVPKFTRDYDQPTRLETSTVLGRRIFEAVRAICPNGQVFHLLTHTIGQAEDVLAVLVDTDVVASFELNRLQPEASATEIEVRPVATYRKTVRGLKARELKVALEAAARSRDKPA
ncbi:MAG: hypothetical protein JNK07_16505 [Alphaproteobacteria bacterium]|nr:hypothetical protein [Alphaproteobacteria bacterium]